MKFICTQDNLSQGLARVVPVAGRNQQLPILQHALLELKDGVLHATCTDLEVGIHAIIPGKVEIEGSCTVVARKFLEFIQQLPKTNPLTIELQGTTLIVETTGYKAKFATGSAEEFPLLPQPEGKQQIVLKAPEFTQALTRTLFAAARDTTRPEIHSVFITGEPQTIHVAATDGFRLVEEVISLSEEQEPFSLLLPLATAQEIVRLFSDQAEIVIEPQETYVDIQGDGVNLSSRLIDGKYPEYQQIIPQSFKTEVIVDRTAFMRALKTLSVFLPRESRRVAISVLPESGTINLSVAGGEAGEGKVEVECEGEGEATEVLFNIQYLLEGTQALPGTQFSLNLTGNNGAVVFKPLAEGIQYLYVVMPIQA